MQILKSIGAVLAGFLTVFILSVATDIVMEQSGFFPPANQPDLYTAWILLIALFYRSVYAMVGGYIVATSAPAKPMQHAFVLGIVGTIGGIAGTVVAWDFGNQWYPIALAVTALPLVWAGAKLSHR